MTDHRQAPDPTTDLCLAAGPSRARSDDELLAFLLILTWSLRTGRTLRAAPDDLSAEELIEFWAEEWAGGEPTDAPRCSTTGVPPPPSQGVKP
ncbi:MAG TPA: hypothetical protein VFU43_23830 [Streptosporangiaceae bacterium]|nr:hypothetical protein [Streptosporangiaceae bacterium]